MDPKTKACPSSPKYIPLDTSENDSASKSATSTSGEHLTATTYTTTGESTSTIPAREIAITTNISSERLISSGGQTPPPPCLTRKEKEEPVAAALFFCLLMATCVVGLVHFWTLESIKNQPVENPEIEVSRAVFSLYNISSTRQMKAEVTLNLTKASNCETAFYDNIVFFLFHAEKPLSVAIAEPFFQNESNRTTVKAIFPQMNAPVEIPDSKLILPRSPHSSLSFEFSFDVNAKGRLWPNINTTEDFIEHSRKIYVWCPNLKVKILVKTGVGMMEGEPAKCKVESF